MPSALFIASHDSQFKWARIVMDQFVKQGWQADCLAPLGFAAVADEQLRDAGFTPNEILRAYPAESLPIAVEYDALFLLTPGGFTEEYIYSLRSFLDSSSTPKHPVIISAYIGIIINGWTGSYCDRTGADLICVNSKYDFELFSSAAAGLGIGTDNLVLTGLPITLGVAGAVKTEPIERVLFAEQAIVPRGKMERKIVFQGLLDYAAAHPDRKVIVKPRHRPGETSFRKNIFTPESFFKNTNQSNVVFDYTPLAEQLPSTDLLLTVSSTAAFEAMALGVRVGIISDAGIRETLGNHIFIQSGLIKTFAQLINDDIGQANPTWLDLHYTGNYNSAQLIFDKVQELVHRRETEDVKPINCPYFEARKRITLYNSRYFGSKGLKLRLLGSVLRRFHI